MNTNDDETEKNHQEKDSKYGATTCGYPSATGRRTRK